MGFWQILTILEKIHKNAIKRLTNEGSGCAKMTPGESPGALVYDDLERIWKNSKEFERTQNNLEEFWLQVLQVFKGSGLALRMRLGRSGLTPLGQRFWRP